MDKDCLVFELNRTTQENKLLRAALLEALSTSQKVANKDDNEKKLIEVNQKLEQMMKQAEVDWVGKCVLCFAHAPAYVITNCKHIGPCDKCEAEMKNTPIGEKCHIC
jgi:hypothetical protein